MQTYRARNPKKSPLWQCAHRHFAAFLDDYPEAYAPQMGALRPGIPEVVHKFLDCGNLERGFARIRCDECQHEYLLAFSCKSRWFCPSCHQRKVQNSAAFITSQVLAPVPHRHYVLALPKMLRPYFQRHRSLLKCLCTLARESITDYLRTALDLPDGVPGIVMTIHTFGEYLDFHPNLHALVADGLFDRDPSPEADGPPGVKFHLLPPLPIKPLEELFRARVIQFLVAHQLLPPQRAKALQSWKHSGFNVHAGDRVSPEAKADLEQLAQYILRNPFSVDKMTLESPGDIVIYRSRMNVKIQRNFEVFTPTDFLAVITQHIPDKNTQMVRYYGFYSNKMRGCRHRALPAGAILSSPPTRPGFSPPPPRRLPSKKWRDLIKQAWRADPLECPQCNGPMRVIAVIDDHRVIEKILRHLGLWCGPPDSPHLPSNSVDTWYYEPYDDGPMPNYENVLTD